MADFAGNRSAEAFSFRSVDRETWQDGPEMGGITGGEVELAAFTDYKATLRMDFRGPEPPEHGAVVRVYYSFEDDGGERSEFPLGTFAVAYSDYDETGDYDGRSLAGMTYAGTANGAGVLSLADHDGPNMPITVTAGTNAVEAAAAVLEGCGLAVRVLDPSAYVLAADHTFDGGASWLEVANWLLGAAGFRSAQPDPMGAAMIMRERDAAEPVFRFAPGDGSILKQTVGVSNDWASSANTFRAFYSDEDGTAWAVASNASGNRMSVDRRGVMSEREQVTQLDGETLDDKLEALKALVETKARDGSREVEHFTVTHPYVPLRPYDCISETLGGQERVGAVTNVKIALSAGAMTETKARRFIAEPFELEVRGGTA